jgi:transketolase
MEEGQVWEAAMFASHQRRRMGRLVAIIDANNSQVDGAVSSVTTLEPLADKWRAFGWQVLEVDGHDVGALAEALTRRPGDAPLALIARTSCLGRLRCLPATLDAHFLKLDEPLRAALEQELTSQLESADA